MKLVVDIPEDLYEGIERRDGALETEYVCDELMKAVDNGAPLPEGHGRLIDADHLKDISLLHNNHVTNKYLVPYKDRNGYRMRDREVMEALINAETIIEADK